MFMEYDTLVETQRKLPKFADDLKVPVEELTRLLNDDWLPYISVVKLPTSIRRLDQRALSVQSLDSDDFACAALASLLSPCILLTHNYKDFRPLGIQNRDQGVNSAVASIEIRVGESRLRGVTMVPAAPVIVVGAAGKAAADRFGPLAWLVLGAALVGGVYVYTKQPIERKQKIKSTAIVIGKALLEEVGNVNAEIEVARTALAEGIVPGPVARSEISTLVREFALSTESLSAQAVWNRLDTEIKPTVDSIRQFLRSHNQTIFSEVRRGGYSLGFEYHL